MVIEDEKMGRPLIFDIVLQSKYGEGGKGLMKLGMGRPRVEAEMGVVPKVRKNKTLDFPKNLQSPHRCVVVLEDSSDGALDQGDLIFSHPFLFSCFVFVP